jgi:hypothetical protein
MGFNVELEFIKEPFHIKDMPLQKVYVLDDYLSTTMHHCIDDRITRNSYWAKTNQVNSDSPTGLPHHSFWGVGFFRGENQEIERGMEPKDTYLMNWFNRKLQTDFGFMWERFQYFGLNSQTQGLEGTTHADCEPQDDWNLSFLYYPNKFWNDSWGGSLRMYDKMQQGIHGREDHIKNHQVAEVYFKPNRLLIFDGRIPHGADAPTERARYADRCSIVLRGDEIELVDKEELYNANDRFHYI